MIPGINIRENASVASVNGAGGLWWGRENVKNFQAPKNI